MIGLVLLSAYAMEPISGGRLAERQGEPERGTRVDGALDAHLPAMKRNDDLADVQA